MTNCDPVEIYMNRVQALANAVDPNKLIGALGRGTGKTTGITAPRALRVASLMPREISIISHNSFVALMTNVIPVLLSAFRQDIKMPDGSVRPMLSEGFDFVVGEKDLPHHFQKPRYPILEPERCIVFANGHVLRAVAVDRSDSIAGSSIVHGIFEEMKYSNGEKLRSRIIPAIRTSRIGAGSDAHKCHLHGGITGVSDIGRVSIGEDNWFTEYESQMDRDLITDILSLALYVNKAQVNVRNGRKLRISESVIRKWTPLLTELRKSAVLYIRASTFINRDVLGFDYFQTQKDILTMSEFLSSICSIGDRNRDNLFFDLWDESKHTYEDGYRYQALDRMTLKDTVTIDAGYLKDYDRADKILLGFDPGNFASMVAGQEDLKSNTLRIMKEFFVYPPDDIPELADLKRWGYEARDIICEFPAIQLSKRYLIVTMDLPSIPIHIHRESDDGIIRAIDLHGKALSAVSNGRGIAIGEDVELNAVIIRLIGWKHLRAILRNVQRIHHVYAAKAWGRSCNSAIDNLH